MKRSKSLLSVFYTPRHVRRHDDIFCLMRTQSRDTSPEAERVLIDLIRKTPGWRRIQLTDRMSNFARGLSIAGLRKRYPDASEAELRRRFADIHLGVELAEKVYGPKPAE